MTISLLVLNFYFLNFLIFKMINNNNNNTNNFLMYKIASISGDHQEPSFFFQRISITIQRFNTFLLHNSLSSEEEWPLQLFILFLTLLLTLKIFTPEGIKNNNLHLITVKTKRSTLHTVYNIQQSATQDSNDMTHGLSRRTAATTRISPEGIGYQKNGAKVLPTSDQVGLKT